MLHGGCHCGANRYELQDGPFDVDYCHCADCRRTTGAPFGVWMDFKVEQVRWTAKSLTEYASSDKVRRDFCPTCGTSLSYRHLDHAEYLSLSVASLDDPSQVPPRYHIYTRDAVDWLEIADTLPRHAGNRGSS